MTVTNAALAQLVAEELQVVQSGESLSADDLATVQSRITKRRAWLIEEGLCYWADDATPDAASQAVAMIVADDCKKAFGVQYDRAAQGYVELQRHVASGQSEAPIQADYY